MTEQLSITRTRPAITTPAPVLRSAIKRARLAMDTGAPALYRRVTILPTGEMVAVAPGARITTMPALGSGYGAPVAVALADLANVAKLATGRGATITLAHDEDTGTITASGNGGSMTIPAHTADDERPESADPAHIPHPGPGALAPQVITLAAEGAADLHTAARVFVSRDETRPVLCGVAVSVAAGLARISATDSYRLYDVRHSASGADIEQVIIPAAAILAAGDTGPVRITLHVEEMQETINDYSGRRPAHGEPWPKKVRIERGGVATIERAGATVTCRLTAGTFPDAGTLIPSEWGAVGRFADGARAALARQLAALPVAMRNGRLGGSLRILAVDDTMSVRIAQVADYGRADVGTRWAASAPLAEGLGPVPTAHDYHAWVHPGYLADALAHAGDDTIRYIGTLRPVLFGTPDVPGSPIVLQMPIRQD